MSTLLSPAQIQDSFETDLGVDPLQLLLDDADAEIIRLFGVLDAQTDSVEGLTRSVFTNRPIDTITTVVEIIIDVSTTLASDDYRVIGNRELRRLVGGTNGRSLWGDEAAITYAPVSDVEQRTRVELDLVKLAIQYNAVKQQSLGDGMSFTFADYEKERRALLSRLQVVLIS